MNHSATQPTNLVSEPGSKILLSYIPCINSSGELTGNQIAQITLNKPAALNALDLEMVELTLDTLGRIRNDDNVLAVFLDSAGDKAFCAGGDIVSMHHAMKNNEHKKKNEVTTATPDFLKDFFTQEYRLDYCLHTYPKPVIVWGNGIIMGGGLGLFTGSKIKLVTETARIAMPEISIGLFPDVGGSYFLNRLPPGVGLFLGLTGASVVAHDALAIGLADALVAHASKQAFIDLLCQLPVVTKQAVIDIANALHEPTQDASPAKLSTIISLISALDNSDSLQSALSTLAKIVVDNPDNGYLAKAYSTYERGSPITAHLVYEQLKRAKGMSLADCFRMELSMAFTCGGGGEFEEGVRALLIDKDNKSAWQYVSISDVPDDVVQAHFSQFTDTLDSAHPLANLEQDFGE